MVETVRNREKRKETEKQEEEKTPWCQEGLPW